MTTPHQYTDATDPNIGNADQQRYATPEFSSGPGGPNSDRNVDTAVQRHGDATTGHQVDPTRRGDQTGDHPTDPRQVDPSAQQGTSAPTATQSATGAPAGDSLFAERDLSELRSRWNDVQAAFVDDPRACVQKADSLVSSAVEQLTASFSQTRSRLEDQWSRGEEASTEDLRIALKHYRDFFDRILAV